jgi:hypothetical protein
MVSQPLRWLDDETDPPPFLKGFARYRRMRPVVDLQPMLRPTGQQQ